MSVSSVQESPFDTEAAQVFCPSESVLWHVGQYILPQHFQTLHRELTQRIATARALALPYPYGLIECRVSTEALSNRMIRFERLRAVLPSGLEINVPADTDLPALTVDQEFDEPFIVYVGVPLWQEARPNIDNAGDGKLSTREGRPLYRVISRTKADENTGDSPQRILVRRISARLLTDSDDKSDMEYLPVLRVIPGTGAQGVPTEDPSFVPPCLLLRGCGHLHRRIEALTFRVEAERSTLDRHLAASGASAATIAADQMERFLRLRTLSRFAPLLRSLVETPGTTLSQTNLALRELLGELAALVPGANAWDLPRFDHDRPAASFEELLQLIPPLLAKAGPPVWSVPFERSGDVMVARLTEEQVSVPAVYYLGIRTGSDSRQLSNLVEDGLRFRCDSRQRLEGLLVVQGVELKEERAPEGLPAPADMHYFRLHRENETHSVIAWQNISSDRTMGLRWPGMESSDFQISLHMVLPAEQRGVLRRNS